MRKGYGSCFVYLCVSVYLCVCYRTNGYIPGLYAQSEVVYSFL